MAAEPASARLVGGGLSADGAEVRLTVDAGDGVPRVLRFGHAAFEQALRHLSDVQRPRRTGRARAARARSRAAEQVAQGSNQNG